MSAARISGRTCANTDDGLDNPHNRERRTPVEPLDLIRTTHEIDRGLAQLAAAVSNARLKEDVLAFEARWRELGFAVAAELCGVEANGQPAPKRRGRRRRAEVTLDGADPEQESSGGDA